jgi:hypothetical protein
MERLRPNNGRARVAIIFMLLFAVVNVISAFSNYTSYNFYSQMEAGEYATDEVTVNDARQGIVALLNLAVYITTVVVFIMWFRRAYYNLHILKAPVQFGEGWAAGSFFVPIMNLGRPYNIMTEIWRETQAYLWPEDERQQFKADNSLIGVWWALFLIWSISSNIVARVYWDPQSISELRDASYAEMFTDILAIPGLIACVMVIRAVSKAEDMLYQHHKRPFDAVDLIVTN